VQFGNPKMMLPVLPPNTTLTPDEVKSIGQFIRNYPYTTLTYLCRKHNWTPAEALPRVLSIVKANQWWDEEQIEDALRDNVERLKDWVPGVSPATKLNKAQAFTLLEHTLKVDMDSDWDVYDFMHRMNLEPEELGAYFADYVVSSLLSQLKYIGGDQKWVFSPETIKDASIHNSWATSTWPKRELTPYVHYCPACGTFYTDTESNCTACGSPRCFKPERPISIPGTVTTGDDLADFDEIANL
jgi:hypothetical protein